MKNLKNKKGFTIVELVIVIAVIAILAAVLIPTFGGVIEKANYSAAQQEARNLYTEYLANTENADMDIEYVEVVKDNKTYYFTVNAWDTKIEEKPTTAGVEILKKVNNKFTVEEIKTE